MNTDANAVHSDDAPVTSALETFENAEMDTDSDTESYFHLQGEGDQKANFTGWHQADHMEVPPYYPEIGPTMPSPNYSWPEEEAEASNQGDDTTMIIADATWLTTDHPGVQGAESDTAEAKPSQERPPGDAAHTQGA